nr:SLC13 family permease [uncultured Clostridium sp.]
MDPLSATLMILILTILAFVSGRFSFSVISVFIIISLTLTGVLKPAEAFSGFSNTNVVMFVAMFVVGAALTKTSLLDRLQKVVVKYKDKPRLLITIACIIGALVATVTSATACAAIMLPLLIGIANEIGLSRKRLLYPVMAVANIATAMTILGQGASNMTWSDVMIKAGGTIPFTVWDFTVARIPVLILSIVYMATIGYRLLPDVPNEEFEDYGGKQGTKSNLTLTPAKEIISLVICCLTILLMFVSNGIHIPMYIIPCIGAVLLVITGVMSEKEALSSIHLPTVFLFAGVLPLSDAMAKSGAGDAVADIMIKMLGNTTNPYIIMLVFILFPLILTQLMSNLATVAIFIPLASTVAVKIGIDPRAAVMASLIAGCASFLTPMAAPCQAMIMGPGGYKLKDYLKSGLPLIIMIVVVTVFYLPLIFPF